MKRDIFLTLAGILLVLAILGLAIAAANISFIKDDECMNLKEKSKVINGKILQLTPYSGFRHGKGGGHHVEGIHVEIAYKNFDNVEKTFFEKWPLNFKDKYQFGDGIELRYYEKNRLVKAASLIYLKKYASIQTEK